MKLSDALEIMLGSKEVCTLYCSAEIHEARGTRHEARGTRHEARGTRHEARRLMIELHKQLIKGDK